MCHAAYPVEGVFIRVCLQIQPDNLTKHDEKQNKHAPLSKAKQKEGRMIQMNWIKRSEFISIRKAVNGSLDSELKSFLMEKHLASFSSKYSNGFPASPLRPVSGCCVDYAKEKFDPGVTA